MNATLLKLVGVASALVAAAAMTGCKRPTPPGACEVPKFVNGRITLPLNESGARIHLPHFLDLGWDMDCKYVRSLGMAFQWHDKKLLPQYPLRGSDGEYIRVHLSILAAGPPNPLFPPPEPWRFEQPVAHKSLPVELYPRMEWSAPDDPRPPKVDRAGARHGVRGTSDPRNGRPFRTHCDLPLPVAGRPDTFAESEFPKGYGDAKCVGGVRVGKDQSEVSAAITVHAAGVPQLDLIYNAVLQFMQESIKD
jgi:hypothetical protein